MAKARESYKNIFQKDFPLISEKKLTDECSKIGLLGDCEIYAERGNATNTNEVPLFHDKKRISNGFLCLNTSGSTGTPKLVKITKGNILANTDAIVESLELDESEISFICLPLSYTFALSQLNTSAERISMDNR